MNGISDDAPIENIIGENETKLSDAEAESSEGEITYAKLAKELKYEKSKVCMNIQFNLSDSFGLTLGCLFLGL